MKSKTEKLIFSGVNFAVLAGFTIFYLLKLNYEFLVYTVSIAIFISIIAVSDKVFNFSRLAKTGFTLWLLLHLLGGSVHINGMRLYDTIFPELIGEPYNILRYDQIMHTLCYFVMMLFVYSAVRYICQEKANKTVVVIISVLAALGIGGVNEIIEFFTVAFFNSTGIGDYYNNALDMVFNFTGTVIAIFFLDKRKATE